MPTDKLVQGEDIPMGFDHLRIHCFVTKHGYRAAVIYGRSNPLGRDDGLPYDPRDFAWQSRLTYSSPEVALESAREHLARIAKELENLNV